MKKIAVPFPSPNGEGRKLTIGTKVQGAKGTLHAQLRGVVEKRFGNDRIRVRWVDGGSLTGPSYIFEPDRKLTLLEELDYMELRLDVALSRMTRSMRELSAMQERLRGARGDRDMLVHYAAGSPDVGLGPGYFTEKDWEQFQKGMSNR